MKTHNCLKKIGVLPLLVAGLMAASVVSAPAPWKPAMKAIQKAPAALKKSSTGQIGLTIQGYCYQGSGIDNPIDSGIVHYCLIPVTTDGSNSPCSDWSQSYYSGSISAGGRLNSSFYINQGTYYIVMNLPPFAVQWWDGKNISLQPVPVTIDKDTIVGEFHFLAGCTIKGIIAMSDGTRPDITVSLLDTTGLEILSTYPDSAGHYSFSGIPLGVYYLHVWGLYENPYFPDGLFASTAQKLPFYYAGDEIDNINWTLRKKTNPSVNSKTGKLSFSNPDSSGSGLAIATMGIGKGGFSFSSTTDDTFSMYVTSNQKMFLARLNNWSNQATISMSYFPGTFLRSKADTIQVKTYQILYLAPPLASGGNLQCRLPAQADSDVTFVPMFVRPKTFQSLGAEPNLYNGYLYMYAPADTYTLWCVPMTEGYKRTQGWGAFRKDTIVLRNNLPTSLYTPLTSVSNTASIDGRAYASTDPMVACFDSLGHCASLTAIPVYGYFQRLTGERWKCFNFTNMFPPPYALRYSLNFLSPGRYSLVKVVPPDSAPGQYTVSWYGGKTYLRTIFSADDVASLTVPVDAAWLTIHSQGEVLQLGQWLATAEPAKREFSAIKFKIKAVSGRKIEVTLPAGHEAGVLKIVTVAGKLVMIRPILKMEKMVSLDLKECNARQLFVCRFQTTDGEYSNLFLNGF